MLLPEAKKRKNDLIALQGAFGFKIFRCSRAFDLSRTLAVTVIVESLLSSGASSAISRKSTVDKSRKEENKETAPAPNKADNRKRQKVKGAAYKKNGEQNKLQSAETLERFALAEWAERLSKSTMPTNVIG